jgi:hypothetical protein
MIREFFIYPANYKERLFFFLIYLNQSSYLRMCDKCGRSVLAVGDSSTECDENKQAV